jgi:antitoxin MazE
VNLNTRDVTFYIHWIYSVYPNGFGGTEMQTAIVKWGNSQGIRLPKAFLQNIDIQENDTVDVILENETIIIKKTGRKEHRTTKERLIDFYGEEFEQQSISQEEIDWGNPIGKEI